jgi:uncharacterized repeat protein (TIGR01451 family)
MKAMLYQWLTVAGVLSMIVATVLFATPAQNTHAIHALVLTPTIPVPPTPEPTDLPPTATPVPPTATPEPELPTATPEPEAPTATPAPPTATPKPKPERDPSPTPLPPTATPVPPTATPEPYFVDVSIRKSVNVEQATVGDVIEYVLEGHNAGPSTAYDVVIRDSVPSEVEITNITSSKGDIVAQGQNVTAYVSVLAPGESVLVRITGRVREGAAGAVSNTGIITTTTPDPNPGNNTSTVTFHIPEPVIQLTIPKRMPTTSDVPLVALLALPVWVPWVLVGLLLLGFGIVLRFWSQSQPEQQETVVLPKPQAAMRQHHAPFVGVPPTQTPLPPPLQRLPLPPLQDCDRMAAIGRK